MTKIITPDYNHACDTGCGCNIANKFLSGPVAAYNAERRDFLRRALVGGVTLAALPLLDAEAQANIFKPSIADQKRLGAQAAQQVLQQYPEVRDSRAAHFNSVGQKLLSALNAKDQRTWDWQYHVIQSKDINAFAVPGGPMFMFTGLLDRIKSDDELAAVTGHEMTHVRLEHWANAAAKQQERGLLISGILGLTRAGAGWQAAASVGDKLFFSLPFSRKEEDQADAGGLQDMVAAGYRPQGMLDLFHTLQTATSGNGEPPKFLSDHPLTTDRIKRTQQRIDRLNAR